MAAAKGKTSSRGRSEAKLRDLSNALAQASWVEADEALAEALVEFAELKRALGENLDAMIMASQALSRAARRRGLTLFGDVGSDVDFDAAIHELSTRAMAARVRVTREGVKRGHEILLRAMVRPVRKPSTKVRP